MTHSRSFATRTLWLFGVLVLASCFGETTGPELRRGMVAFAPRFDRRALTAVTVDHVHIVIVDPVTSKTVLDTNVVFPANVDTLDLSLPVPLTGNAQTFDLTLDMLDPSNNVLFHAGPSPVTATTPGVPPQANPLVIHYVGTGANAKGVRFTASPTNVFFGDSVTFVAEAFDSNNVTIPNTPILFISSDSLKAKVPSVAAGKVLGLNARGSVTITAQLLTPPNATAPLTVQPKPNAIVITAGNNQTGPAGQQLATTITARVNAADNLGVQGVVVTYAVTGGGTLSKTTDTTNATGDVSVVWTLGGTPGGQSMSVVAGTLAAGVVNATATAPPVQLLHRYTFDVGAVDSAGTAAGSLVGGASVANGILTLDGTSGYVQFASHLVPTSGSYTVALFARRRVNQGQFVEWISQGSSNGPGFYLGLDPTGLIRAGDPWIATGLAAPPADSQFHQYALVVDSLAQKSFLYVDGALGKTLNAVIATTAAGDNTRLGAQFGTFGEYFAGDLDEVRIYHGALSGAQVTALNTLPASRLGFITQPASASPGVTMAAVRVAVQDALGRTVTTDNSTQVTIAIGTNPAGGTLGGSATATAVAGVATFSNLTIDNAGTGYTLGAAATGLVGAISSAFNVTSSIWDYTADYSTTSATFHNWTVGVHQSGGTFAVANQTSLTGGALFGWNAGAGGGDHTKNISGAIVNTFFTAEWQPGQTSFHPGSNGDNGADIRWISPIAGPVSFNANFSGISLEPLVGTTTNVHVLVNGVQVFTDSIRGSVPLGLGTHPRSSFRTTQTVAVGDVIDVWVDDAGLYQSDATGVTVGITVNSALVAKKLAFLVSPPSSVNANTAIAPAVQVGVVDSVGNLVTGYSGTVTLAIGTNPGGSTLGGTATASVVGGIATFGTLTLDKAGTGYTLAASSGTLTGATSSAFTVTGGAATHLAFAQQPSAAISGVSISPAVTVQVLDANNTIVPSASNAVTIAIGNNPGSGTLGGTATVAAASGVATFANLSINANGTGYTLTAAATGLTGATSTAFDIGLSASVNQWINAAGGNWSNPANWSKGTVPTAAESVAVVLSGTYTVTLDTTFTGGFILVGGASGSQTLTLSSRTLTINGAMRISGGGVFSADNSTIAGAGAVTNQGTLTLRYSTLGASTSLNNQGTVVMNGAVAVNGPLTTNPATTIRLLPDGTTGFATLTAANGFTNTGTIELTSSVSSYSSQVSVTSGTLTNASTGTITTLVGTGGPRTLDAQLDNQGTLTMLQPLALSHPSAAHTNSGTIDATAVDWTLTQTGTTPSFTNTGTITIGPTHTWAISGGALNLNTGSVIAGAGTLSLQSVTATFTPNFTNATTTLAVDNSTLNGPGTITNAAGKTLTLRYSTLGASTSLINLGTVIMNGAVAVNGPLTTNPATTIRLLPDGTTGFATLTTANGFTNTGTIELTSSVSSYSSQVSVASGTLTNASTGTITTLVGTGGPRTLDAQLDNQGTLTMLQPLALSHPSAAHSNSGTIDASAVDWTLTQTGTTPSFTNTGTITIGPTHTWTISGGALNLNTGSAVGGAGTLSLSSVVATFTPNFTNATTTLAVDNSTLNGPGTITNAAGKTLTLRYSTIAATSALINLGTVIMNGAVAVNGPLTTNPATTIRLLPDGTTGFATLTTANGFTNTGTIELTSSVSSYSSQVSVASGTLTNASTGTITTLVGTGGPRTLDAQLDNQGTLTMLQPLALSHPSAAHSNSGTIDASAVDWTLTQTGTTPSFTNTGTITIGPTHTWTISGGALNLNTGSAVGGAGTLSLSSVVATFTPNFTNATTTLAVDNSTLNGPGTITNAAGKTLTLRYSTIAATSALINLGTVIMNGAVAVNGPLTTNPGTTIRLLPDGTTGFATLTTANGFTNTGAIELTSSVSSYSSQVSVTSGTLTNASTGTITTLVGTGGPRTIDAQLDNQGTLTMLQPLALSHPSAAHSNSGTIDASAVDWTLTQTGTTPSFTNTGTITIGPTHTWTISGGALNLNTGSVIAGAGTLSLSSVVATFTPNFTNATTTLAVDNSTLNGPGTITNAAGKTLTLRYSTIAATSALINLGTVVMNGAVAVNGPLTTNPGTTIRLLPDGSTGFATLTVPSVLVNNGLIELTSSISGYSSQITVTSDSLINTSTGTIAALPGTGGARTLAAKLNNQGAVNASTSLSMPNILTNTATGALNVTAGTLSLGGGGTLGGMASATGSGIFNIGGGDFSLSGNFGVTGGLSLSGNGVLDHFNGHSVTVSGDLALAGSSRVDMFTTPTDSMIVQGNVLWNTTSAFETLTNGVLVVGGNFSQGGAANSFKATSGHLTLFTGAGAQAIQFANPDSTTATSHFGQLVIDKSAGAVTLASNAVVLSNLTLRNAANVMSAANERLIVRDTVSGSVGTSLTPRVVAIGVMMRDSGTFSPDTTIFLARGPFGGAAFDTIPDTLVYGGSPVAWKNIVVQGPGDAGPRDGSFMTINGSVIARNNAGFYVGLHGTITINDSLRTETGGTFAMSGTIDQVIVNRNATFAGGSTNGDLLGGTLRVRGNFKQLGDPASFSSTGTDVTFDGSSPQIVTFQNPGAGTTLSHFNSMTVGNSTGVQFASDATIIGNATLQGGPVSETGGARTVTIGNALLDFLGVPGGAWRPTNTVLAGASNLMPAELTTNVTFTGAAAPDTSFILVGNLNVSGSSANLTAPPGVTTVLGNISTTNGGTLAMSALSQLAATGNAVFSGGDETPKLTGGVLAVGGNFTQTSGTSTATFAASGTSVLLNGTATQTVSFTGIPSSYFNDLVVTNAGTVNITGGVLVGNDFTHAGGTVGGTGTLTVFGNFTTAPSITAFNMNTLKLGGGVNITSPAATVAPANVEFFGTASPMSVIDNMTYNNVVISGIAQLNSNLVTIGGFLSVDGSAGGTAGSFDLNDNGPLSVAGNFATVNGGRLIMQFGEQLSIGGSVTFAGGKGDSLGINGSGGMLLVGGSFGQLANATAFQPDSSFTVEFNGTAPQTVTFSDPGAGSAFSHFGNLSINNSSPGVTLGSNIFAQGQLMGGGANPSIFGQGHIVTVQGLNVIGMTIDNAPLVVNDGSFIEVFNNVTFQGSYATTADILTLNRGSQGTTLPLDGLSFPTIAFTTGHWLVANDPIPLNGPDLVVSLTNASPANSLLNFVQQLGGATVTWLP